MYNKLILHSKGSITGIWEWDRSMSGINNRINWDKVWSNCIKDSCNPDHQFIHFKFCHRVYVTPQQVPDGSEPQPRLCILFSGLLGTHGMGLSRFTAFGKRQHKLSLPCRKRTSQWTQHFICFTTLLNFSFPVWLKVWLAGLSAAKKHVAQSWILWHNLTAWSWYNALLEILYQVLSAARTNTGEIWMDIISSVRELLQSHGPPWLSFFWMFVLNILPWICQSMHREWWKGKYKKKKKKRKRWCKPEGGFQCWGTLQSHGGHEDQCEIRGMMKFRNPE